MTKILTGKKSTEDAKTRAGFRWLMQKDPYLLAKVISEDRTENTLSDGLHRSLCDYLQTTPWPMNMYLISREHQKTSIITVARNCQRILNNQQIRILIGSNKAENAQGMLTELKAALLTPRLLWAFPDILWPDPARQAEKWTNSEITVKRKRTTKEHTVESTGTEGEITSRHYDHASFDDLVGKENTESRDQIRNLIAWWQAAQSLMDRGSTQDITGTHWAHGDLYWWLIEQWRSNGLKLGIFRQPCYKTTAAPRLLVDPRGNVMPDEFVRDDKGKLIPALETRFTLQSLEDKKKIVGSVNWAAQWLLSPGDDDEAVFPRNRARIVSRQELPPLDQLNIVMAVDPAISENKWADYTAIAVVGFDIQNRMWVLDLRRGRWPEAATIDHVYAAFRKTSGIQYIGFEAIGFAKLYRREFARAMELRGYLPIHTLERDTKRHKNTRILSLSPFWDTGEIFFLDELEALDDFLDEASRFRRYRESLHDDMLDALADTLQMRSRPEQKQQDDWGEDPDVIERLQFEARHRETRRTQGHTDLDRGSLRNAWLTHKRQEAFDAERERMMDTSALGEF